MITKLPWDSNFFSLEIYCTEIQEWSEEDYSFFQFEMNSIPLDLVYIFSLNEIPLKNTLIKFGDLYLVDKKIVFTKSLIGLNNLKVQNVVLFENENPSLLYDLSFEAGKFSRFKKDIRLNYKFKELYQIWVDNSIKGSFADFTLIYKLRDSIQSFVTGKVKNNIGKIGLIATLPTSQGKGIGSKILKEAERYFSELNAINIEVDTQLENKLACSFYKKNGFEPKNIIYIYHYYPRK